MAAYYNEHDRQKAAWLRELMRRDLIAPGRVDERSIADVQPRDLDGYTQCHFFAGVGVWSYALFNAGWFDSDSVWTGSCPCQPFSAAGKGQAFGDARHLWPHWFRLIRECRPGVVFGEQVASPPGLTWLDLVCADMEGAGYAVGPCDFPAASVGAPHKRQRLYFVADTTEARRGVGRSQRSVGDQEGLSLPGTRSETSAALAHAGSGRLEATDLPIRPARQDEAAPVERRAGPWSAADWIPCADGKTRPVERGLEPVVDGTPSRLVRLRGYGDAIIAEQATAFIEAYLDVRGAA